MAAFAAIFDIVMDRMIAGGDRLEGREMRLGYGAARDRETLANRQILEVPALRHDPSGMKRMFSEHSRPIVAESMPSSARMAAPCSPMRGARVIVVSTASG